MLYQADSDRRRKYHLRQDRFYHGPGIDSDSTLLVHPDHGCRSAHLPAAHHTAHLLRVRAQESVRVLLHSHARHHDCLCHCIQVSYAFCV